MNLLYKLLNYTKPKSIKRVLLSCFLMVCSFIVLLALFSYYPKDPSFVYSYASAELDPSIHNTIHNTYYHNFIGAIGAYIASVLLYFFGSAGWLFPFILGIISIVLYKDLISVYKDRIGALILLLPMGALFSSLYNLNCFSSRYGDMDAGGLVGLYGVARLFSHYDIFIAYLFVYSILICLLLIIFRLHLVYFIYSVLYYLIYYTVYLLKYIYRYCIKLYNSVYVARIVKYIKHIYSISKDAVLSLFTEHTYIEYTEKSRFFKTIDDPYWIQCSCRYGSRQGLKYKK